MTTQAKIVEVDETVRADLPAIVPAGWRAFGVSEDGFRMYHPVQQLMVIVSDAIELDGKRWRHFSLSHQRRIPTWKELVECKEVFLGTESKR